MRFTLREQPIKKALLYSLCCFLLLLFSYSFIPATSLFTVSPVLLVAAVSSLAFFEGVKYAALIGVVAGALEGVLSDSLPLTMPLFYSAFAILLAWLFENFFVKNFLSWVLYTFGGLLAYEVVSLFAPVSNWQITAADLLLELTLPRLLFSSILSLAIFPLFRRIKRKTDK